VNNEREADEQATVFNARYRIFNLQARTYVQVNLGIAYVGRLDNRIVFAVPEVIRDFSGHEIGSAIAAPIKGAWLALLSDLEKLNEFMRELPEF
jgi:hypothetical protein